MDSEKVGFSVTVFLGIKLAEKAQIRLKILNERLQPYRRYKLWNMFLGVYDYRIRIIARDIADFERILRRRIMTLPELVRLSKCSASEENSRDLCDYFSH